jgi:hypothetical protein
VDEAAYVAHKAIDPYETALAFFFVRQKYGDPAPYPVLREAYGPLADYDVNSQYQLARSAQGRDKAAFVEWSRRACELYVDLCEFAAQWAADEGRDYDAATAYHRWFDEARDRVDVSNGIGWLVDYEYGRGRKAEALRLAQGAAETYSSVGLKTLAWVLERNGELAQAEDYYRRHDTRYGAEPSNLIGFYKRSVDKGARQYESAFKAELAKAFPGGLEPVASIRRDEPPKDGARAASGNARSAAAGLFPGNVIVALDGYRVRTQAQFQIVRSFTEDPAMTLLVWNGKGYVEIKTSQKYRRFGIEIEDYKP